MIRRARYLRSVVMFVVSVGCLTAAGAQQPEGDFAITDVRLFDGERVLPSATIVTRDGRIAQVSPTGLSQLPAVVIDGRGRTVLPGLIDAHVHSFDETALRDAIRFGVTTVLDMFCPVEDAAKLRALRGQPSVADYYSAGPVATAPGGHGTQYGFPTPTLSAPADADAFVAARIAEGSDYIKIIIEQGRVKPIPTLDAPTVETLVTSTHTRGKLAVAHATRFSDAETAVRAGVDGLVHLWTDAGAVSKVSALAASRGVFVVPTLAVFEGFLMVSAGGGALVADPQLKPYLTESIVKQLTSSNTPPGLSADALRSEAPALRRRLYDAVRDLREARVHLLAGTDAPNIGTWYGVSLHRELELLVEAGLTPTDALIAATSAPASAFKLADRGRVEKTRWADLVLVEGDPTTNIKATRAIVAVWKRGQRVNR